MDPQPRPASPSESFPSRAAPPPSIPGYRIESVIGRGSTGLVYRAVQLAVDREVALKVLHPELAGKTQVVRRLQREARTAARLAHPHIVSAIDMGECEDLWWYAMELVDGPSLSLRLKQEGRLNERLALRIFIPLCEALVHLWEHGVVHRDVKPSNVLIDSNGVARLADLGLAFATDDPQMTHAGGTLGTPHYLSPEQAIDPISVDVRSDIWSYGATLFHAVCGRPPFAGETVAEVLSAVLYAPISDPHQLEPELSRGMVLILRKCLSRSPERRYQTPYELLLDLERVRERRKPKIRAASLEPVEGSMDPLARIALAVGGLALAGTVAGLFVARPWESAEEVAADLTEAPQPYPPLEQIAESVEAEPGYLRRALERIEAIDPPDAYEARRREIASELRARVPVALGALARELEGEVEGHLEAGRFEEAREALDVEERLRQRTGFGLADLGLQDASVFLITLDDLDQRVRQALAREREEIARRLDVEWRERIEPEVDELVATDRWDRARAHLDLDRDALLALLPDVRRELYPPDVLAEATRPLERRIDARRERLDEEWFAQFEGWLRSHLSLLRENLRSGELARSAGAVLRERFGERSDTFLFDRMPPRLAERVRGELETQSDHLDVYQDRLRRSAALVDFLALEASALDLLRDRRYPTVAGLWRDFALALTEHGPATGAAWEEELLARVQVRREEAQILQEVLARAAEGIGARDGGVIELALSRPLTGTVRAGFDPLRVGFHLTTSDGFSRSVGLRELTAADLERLAGLSTVAPETLEPPDRLQLALFRFHEDRVELARAAFESGELPESDLAELLRMRIDARGEAAAAVAAEREAAARDLLALRDLGTRDHLLVVDRLLTELSDVPVVRESLAQLRKQRDDLRRPEARADAADFEQRFGPDEVQLGRERAELVFRFDASAGAWKAGRWFPDGRGWIAPESVGDWSGVLERPGPSLELGSPLDIDAGPLEVVLEIEQPAGSGPPRLLVVSVGGYHFALVGARATPDGRTARWQASAGTLGELVRGLEQGGGSSITTIRREGWVHRITVVVHRRQGRASIEVVALRPVDDSRPTVPREEVVLWSGDLSFPSSSARLETRVVEVRSWEPVRLLSAIVRAPY